MEIKSINQNFSISSPIKSPFFIKERAEQRGDSLSPSSSSCLSRIFSAIARAFKAILSWICCCCIKKHPSVKAPSLPPTPPAPPTLNDDQIHAARAFLTELAQDPVKVFSDNPELLSEIKEVDDRLRAQWKDAHQVFLYHSENNEKIKFKYQGQSFFLTTELLKYYESQFPDLTKTFEGKSTLHVVRSKKTAERLLFSLPELLNQPDSLRRTPLHDATENHYLEVMETLIDRGANLKAQDQQGRTALHYAQSKEAIDLLCSRCPALLKICDQDGNTPLHLAVKSKQLTLAKLLIERGSDPAEVNSKNGNTLLLCIDDTLSDFDQYAIEVLDLGAPLNIPNRNGETPLSRAIAKKHHPLALLYLKKGASLQIEIEGKPLAYFLAEKIQEDEAYWDLLNALIVRKYSFNLNAVNRSGETALALAMNKKDFELAQLLINNGASLEVEVQGKPFFYFLADQASNDEKYFNFLKDLLFQKKLDLNAYNEKLQTYPLLYAFMASLEPGKTFFLHLAFNLVEKGASLNIQDPSTKMPFIDLVRAKTKEQTEEPFKIFLAYLESKAI